MSATTITFVRHLDSSFVNFSTPYGNVDKPLTEAKRIAELSGNIAELQAALQNPGLPIPVGTKARVPKTRNYARHGITLF